MVSRVNNRGLAVKIGSGQIVRYAALGVAGAAANSLKNLAQSSCLPEWDIEETPFPAQCNPQVINSIGNFSRQSDFWAQNSTRDLIYGECGVYARSEFDNQFRSVMAICGRILTQIGVAIFDEATRQIIFHDGNGPCSFQSTESFSPTYTTLFSTQSIASSSDTFTYSHASNTAGGGNSAMEFLNSTKGIILIIVGVLVLIGIAILAFFGCTRRHATLPTPRPLPPTPMPSADDVARSLIRIQSETMFNPDDNGIYDSISLYERPSLSNSSVSGSVNHEYEYDLAGRSSI